MINNNAHAERILSFARTQFFLVSQGKNRFFARYVMPLVMVADPDVTETISTDGIKIYYNPDWVVTVVDENQGITGKSQRENRVEGQKVLQGVILHEALHCALLHLWRIGGRDAKLWNIAGDYAVNAIIKQAGIPLPKDALLDDAFSNMTTEAIYAVLARESQNNRPSQGDQNNQNGQSGQSSQDSQGGQPEQSGQNNQPVQGGQPDQNAQRRPQKWGDHDRWGQAALDPTAGKTEQNWRITAATGSLFGNTPNGMERHAAELAASRVRWRDVLARHLQPAKNDFRWLPPDRNHLWRGIYLPTLSGQQISEAVIAIDTSGSIDQSVLSQFLAEVRHILQIYEFHGYVACLDSRLHEWHEIRDGRWPDVKFKGGGGTNFSPVFEEIEKRSIRPSCLVFLTDLYGSFPKDAPPYPVLWTVYGGNWDKPPFGERVSISA